MGAFEILMLVKQLGVPAFEFITDMYGLWAKHGDKPIPAEDLLPILTKHKKSCDEYLKEALAAKGA